MPIPEGYFEIKVRHKKYKRYFRKILSEKKGIIGWFGVEGDDGIGPRGGRSVIVAYWFSKKKWTPERARAWVREHIEETVKMDENETIPEIEESYDLIEEAKWTRAYINDLPDSAFAVIEPGGKKDETGRTVPRSLRHLPYKDASGKVDIPHLRNAWARRKHVQPVNMSKEEFIRKAEAVLRPLLKRYGIEVEEALSTLSSDIEELRGVVNSLAVEANKTIKRLNEALRKAELIMEIKKLRRKVAELSEKL